MMIVDNSPVGSSKDSGVVGRAVPSVKSWQDRDDSQLTRREVESGSWNRAPLYWLCVVECAGFGLSMFEVGHHGRRAYERLKGNPVQVQGIMFADGILRICRVVGCPLGKPMCM